MYATVNRTTTEEVDFRAKTSCVYVQPVHANNINHETDVAKVKIVEHEANFHERLFLDA